ncbi:MAG: tryptophan-rich sensory protein [Ruminococcaceae bacterium]|nr:tryptophan-rich sensory protein [Oscillospiraceae bacterium]
MKKEHWKVYAFWIALSEAVGLIAGFLIRRGVEIYGLTAVKPPLSPPDWVFPVVWTILYALMGISAARVWLAEDSPAKRRSVSLFITQLVVNFFWPLFFFNLQAYGFALVWLILLWVLVFLLILNNRRVDMVASWLLIPYLIWLTFAVYLNIGVYLLN